jgi:AcrR family transcriptional regulator
MSSAVTSATRRRLPREERARQLLDVAEELFAERGVQSSSMDDIAEAAGVTKPILYDHYGSKDRLVAAVILRAGATLGDAVLGEVSASASSEDALASGLRAYFEFIEARRSGLHSLLTEGVNPGTDAAAALEAVRDQQADMIAALLLERTADPNATDSMQVRTAQAQIYAQIVIGATERLATRPGLESTPSVDELTRHVMDVIWCGFGTLRDGTRWEPAAG